MLMSTCNYGRMASCGGGGELPVEVRCIVWEWAGFELMMDGCRDV